MAEPTPKAAIVVSPRDAVARSLQDYFSPANRQASLAKLIHSEGLSAESVTTSAIAEVVRTEALWACTPQSIFDCVLAATALQLRVGKDLGHAYILPFRDTKAGTTNAQFLIGYRGLVTLARRSGEIESITANLVHKHDKFDAAEGSDGHLRHSPDYFNPKGRGEVVGAYAYAKLVGGGEQWAIMSLAELDAIRGRSKASGSGPWVTDTGEMQKKTVVRRLCKMLPISVDAQEAVRDDEDREFNEARDVSAGRPQAPALSAQSQSGGERVRTQAAAVREAVGIPSEPQATNEHGEPLDAQGNPEKPAATVEEKPAEEKKPKAAKAPKADVVIEKPAEKKPTDPGAGFEESSRIIANAEQASTRDELMQMQDMLNDAIESGRIGVTNAARASSAIKAALVRVDAAGGR